MSYLKKTEYRIVPIESFTVIRNCSGCGTKAHYRNTNRFRVNANGNQLDIWLIYQCERCKHTLNLSVYERQKAAVVPKEEYRRFLSNDEELAKEYGRNFSFFKKNKAEIDIENMDYRIVKLCDPKEDIKESVPGIIIIHNPYELKIRPEKQIAEVLELSRSNVKKLMEQGRIRTELISRQSISFVVDDLN